MEQIFSIPPPLLRLCQRLKAHGFEAYLVGGGVRDLQLGRPVQDWDVATSAQPTEVQALFPRTIPTGIKHGTVTVLWGIDDLPGEGEKNWKVEVTTYRGEGAYSDARHPDSIRFVSSLQEDLSRRDFTMNAMALDPLEQQLVDPFQGGLDIQRRLIRAVGDPHVRFSEDGLRPMRAVRFAAVLEFQLEEETLAAIKPALASFGRVSAERVRDELLKLLVAPRPSVGLELMQQTGLLSQVLPELEQGIGLSQNRHHSDDVYHHSLRACDEMAREDPVLRLSALLHDVGKPMVAAPHPHHPGEQTFYGHETAGAKLCDLIGRRLKLSNEQRLHLVHLVAHHFFALLEWTPPKLRRFIRQVGAENLPDLFALREADLRARDTADKVERIEQLQGLRREVEKILEEKSVLGVKDLALNGRDIMDYLGISAGPRVGQILGLLLEQVLENPALNQKEKLLLLVNEINQATS